MSGHSPREQVVTVLAPTGRDALLTPRVLAEAGVVCTICEDLRVLGAEVAKGVGAVLLAEEAIASDARLSDFVRTLREQPAWSDVPVMLLTARGADSATAARALDLLGNVTLLERPLRVGALVSTARFALRARQRQYQIRAHLAEREK